MSVLDGIDVDVIDVTSQIIIIPDLVLPESSLPNAAFTFEPTAFTNRFATLDASREAGLDQHPAAREIGIPGRQGPDRVQVIGQHYPGHDLERVPAFDDSDRGSQIVDAVYQQPAGAVGEIDGEEISAAGSLGARPSSSTPTCARRTGWVIWCSVRKATPGITRAIAIATITRTCRCSICYSARCTIRATLRRRMAFTTARRCGWRTCCCSRCGEAGLMTPPLRHPGESRDLVPCEKDAGSRLSPG